MLALVTGGAGFIGSHIVDELLKRGYDVRVLDNLERRVHPKGKPDYIPEDIEFIEGDIADKETVRKALKGVDVVFHQAAYQDYMPDFSKFFRTNVVGTAMIYEVIAEDELEVEKIIVASSQAVYGEGQYECPEHGFMMPPARSRDQLDRGEWELRCPLCGRIMKNLPLREEHVNPYNQYALSKYSGEITALRLGYRLGIPTVALRYSITQGPRQSLYNQYSGICRIFTLRLLNDKPPIIFEDGLQQRDYVHVDDVVRANMMALEDERANYEAFNVGGGKATTVIEYARLLARKLNKAIEPVIPGEYRFGDNRHSVSSIEKIRSLLGWKPHKGLEEIFEDYIAWVREQGDLRAFFEEADRLMRQMQVIRKSRVEGRETRSKRP